MNKFQLASKLWRNQFALLVVLVLAILAAGCGQRMADSGKPEAQAAGAAVVKEVDAPKMPEVLRVGVLPGEEEGKLSRGNKKFVEDLGIATGLKTELFVGDDYTAVIEAMRTKKIDIASFGPFAYIIAAERSGAVPFAVKATSLEAAFYNSLVVVPASSTAQTIADLKGKTFLFADPASASGHLFPRAIFINKLGVKNEDIESFFSNVSFSGGHDKSIMAIAKGTADGAGVCDTCIQKVIDAGLVKTTDFRILAKSDPIPTSPYTYRKDLPVELVEKIKTFMFDYHTKNPQFFANGTQKFFPIEDKDFKVVKDTAKALNMDPAQLLK
ncbi:phosphate/phosphite/phosphonate ABC transporter substrate-binding protein [Paenibacillus agricola]|uniref:Phosphate/phosphite/phosphonate ABC transporter substrate-binding protein n=1 Tax=Paenibacillus agricola TaxID=2716264 RepID=A0ABX0JCC7_9BACL|nr:phosphate/phosphite/phosphonate ABC transporter substrate-binding protein [Paenibacillus agricola]NHN34162.1 phosphate/phosphite/phosphonate ABC transporter substrate-binding protein [Paenibacillus agricola]